MKNEKKGDVEMGKNVIKDYQPLEYQSSFSDFLKKVEKKWKEEWERQHVYEADPDPKRPKFMVTFPYPYVNGSVHLGHGYSVLKADMIARYKRMRGFNVLFPQGFHATGEPIVGMAKQLAKGEETPRRVLRIFGVPEEELDKFTDPKHIVNYFVPLMINDMKSVGLAIDWRRKFVTTTLTPVYSKFVEWQYLTLRDLGYVGQGSHPVIWCPNDKSPTGDHDRLIGEGVGIVEYVLLKFKAEGTDKTYFVPATLRPETIFGVTNMFLHPETKYQEFIRSNGEIWIISAENMSKFKDQFPDGKEGQLINPRQWFGKTCQNPVTKDWVPILPAWFIDPEASSGVVMSVPGHAPVDWVALQDLVKNPEKLEVFGLKKDIVEKIKPISLISVEGFGEFPAVEIVQKMNITSQDDKEQLKAATQEIYKKEFHLGICKDITGKYKGLAVKDAKERLIKDFKEAGFAEILYEPADLVVCRCGTRCYVKVLENQWFLLYSNKEWKKKAKKALKQMAIYPPIVKQQFERTIDWLEDKACARKTGLGTPLPWDNEWIVETLSDSTIYMAYYTISKYVNQGLIEEKHAIPEFFDYIIRDIGSAEEIAQMTDLSVDIIKQVKQEFEYWYPMDLRCSGKDLVPNHLTFCLLQHVALFKPEHWPRAFSVNGFMKVHGKKMSKSRGVLTPLSEAVSAYGADLTRLGLLGAGEGIDDANLSEDDIRAYDQWLEQFYNWWKEEPTRTTDSMMDLWLRSRLQKHIKAAINAVENLQTRTYIQIALFGIMNDIKWYKHRVGHNNLGPAYKEALKVILLLLTPCTPHLCEHIWHDVLNESDFIINQPYPTPNDDLINEEIEDAEEYIRHLIEDIEHVKRVLKIEKPQKIELTLAPAWQYKVYYEAMKDKSNLIKRLMQMEEFKPYKKELPNYAKNLMKIPHLTPIIDRELEEKALNEAKTFLERIYQCDIIINDVEHAKNNPRAKQARPNRPAITLA